jgi:zinc transporter 1/2/3
LKVVPFCKDEAADELNSSSGKQLGHFFVILALSFHSVFEGLAIGLQNNAASTWLLFVGVGAHKFLIAFCVGMELFTSRQQSIKTAAGYLVTFAVMSPLGIAIGLGVTEKIAGDHGTQAAVVGILQVAPRRHILRQPAILFRESFAPSVRDLSPGAIHDTNYRFEG